MPSLLSLFGLLQPAAHGGDVVGALWGDGLGGTSPFGWAPVILLGGPVLVAVVLLWLYARTAREHRRAQMAPPVWLLPYLERPPEAGGDWRPPALDADHAELEELRLESTARLARRKRGILVGLGLNFVAGWAAAAVYLYTGNRAVEFQELPPTIALGASVDTITFQGIEGPGTLDAEPSAPAPAAIPDATPDTAQLRIRREQQWQGARRRDSLAEVRRQDSIAVVEAVARGVRDSVAQVVRDSIAMAQAAAVMPVAVPLPLPPPPPPPPAPDPAVERTRATAAIQAGAEDLVAAVNARGDGLAALLASGDGRERLVRFVQERSPTATLVRVAVPTLSADQAASVVTLQYQWRGPFGDTRRGEGRFEVEVRVVNDSWQVVRLVPLSSPQ